MTQLSPFANGRDERGRGARSSPAMPQTRSLYLRISVVPAVVIAVLCVGATVFTLSTHASVGTIRLVLAIVTGGVVLMLIAAILAADAASRQVSRQVTRQVNAAQRLAQHGQAELHQLVERVLRGEQPAQQAPTAPASGQVPGGDSFQFLTREIEQSWYLARQAVLMLAEKVVSGGSDQRVQIFVNLARRMQSLVHREIELLDDLEARVEDPELLKGLFTVDHLATRMRRQSESLAVLGGSASRRQWTRQVTMHEVLRAAIAEIEQYSRVKVVPPVEGVLRGAAVSDVIHLIAELVENATKFSPPRTSALLRAQKVAAGVAIEVEDRGLGMLPADQQRMNALLADPATIDIDELLRDGRIGLYVVSILARRHGIRVQLQNNIYGGTQAVVVLPSVLLDTADSELPRAESADERGRELATVSAPDLAYPQTGSRSGQSTPYARRTMSGSRAAGSDIADDAGLPNLPAVPRREVVQPAVPSAERPPLPRRQVQVNLAAELRDRDHKEQRGSKVTPQDEPPADQMTGLMAEFLGGVNRSAEEDDSPERY